MNDFTASNGITLRITDDPYLDFGPHQTSPIWLKPEELVALREFFRAEEDERLGLWRSKADPTWTAVRRNTMVYLHNDDHERSFHFLIGNEATLKAWSWDLQQIAKEYMDAHPEPKPWHDAKPGDVWILKNAIDRHALIWRSYSDWDLIDPRGDSQKHVADPLAALANAGYDFSDYTATRLVEES